MTVKLFLIPFQNVDRDRFLSRHSDVCGVECIRRRSRRLVVLCCLATSFLTFLATLPTNVWVSIFLAVLDFIQFQFFVFVIQQQLLYLYGFSDLREGGKIHCENGMFLLWLQNEVMLGSRDSITIKVKSGVGFAVRKLLAFFVTKSPFRIVIVNALRQLLKWFGVIAAHQFIDISIDLIVCVMCALIAAGVSLWQFYPMCRNLRQKIDENGIEYYAECWRAYNSKPDNAGKATDADI